MKFHEMWAILTNRWYRCAACQYESDLAGAVAHAVAKQPDLT